MSRPAKSRLRTSSWIFLGERVERARAWRRVEDFEDVLLDFPSSSGESLKVRST